MPKKTNTKSIILEKAITLFAERGYHGASIREIAKMVGIRESAIYNHFSSKEKIYYETIFNSRRNDYSELILDEKLMNKISKPEEFLKILAENTWNFWNDKNERMFIKMLLNSNRDLNDYTLSHYFQEFENICVIIFKEMINYKFIQKSDPQLLADEFISPLVYIYLKSIHFNLTGYGELIKDHVEFFWKSVKR